MEIRPHRRIVIRLDPPFFEDFVKIIDFVSVYGQDFGVALFGASLALSHPRKLRKLCDSTQVKMMVDVRGLDHNLALEACDVCDYALFSGAPMPLARPEAVAICPSGPGVYCLPSEVEAARQAGRSPILVELPDVEIDALCDAARDSAVAGAGLFLVGRSVVKAQKPGLSSRFVAEQLRHLAFA